MVRTLSNYVVPAEVARSASGCELDWSVLFGLIGDLPLEFFSTRTVFTDFDGIQGAADLIEALGRQDL